MRSNGPFFMLATFMVSSVDGHAVIMNTQCDRLNACAVGTCATIMGMTPTTGGSLSISGLTNGGTYTPGGTYGLSFSGSGERIFYTTAGSLSGDTGCGALSSITTSPTLTAPSSGTMTIVAISSQGPGSTVSYQRITVTAAVAPAAAPPSSPKMPPSPTGALPTCPPFGTGWTTKVLDASINYVASTKVVGSVFHLRLEALTTGWLGFGFAEPTSGHMKGSDLLTTSVVNGVVRIEDRHALKVTFEDGAAYVLPAEYLRVESPSAEVQGHGGRKTLLRGKADVGVQDATPVGRYAVRISFDDGHDTVIYSWDYLRKLGEQQDALMAAYRVACAGT
jgi:DUF971 family protein